MQEPRGLQHNARDSAILHSGKQSNTVRSGSDNSETSVKTKPKSMAVHAGHKQAQPDQRQAFKASHKRHADFSRDQPSRKRRGGPQQQRNIDLKDEAWLRKEMHVPTKSDYPDMPEIFFKEPKAGLVNATMGLVNLSSNFVNLAHEIFRCTLRYESVARNMVVEGEGRSKVSFLCVDDFNDAKRCRNLPSGPPIYI